MVTSLKKQKTALAVLLAILCVLGIFLSWKLKTHEKQQNARLIQLESDVGYLREKQRQSEDYYEYQTEYTDDSFNYFAIGNSLTLIKSWGRGICSTRPDNDYFHLVTNYLGQKHNKVVAYPYNFAIWERSSNRSSTLNLLDVYLSDKLDLVTIQLGENVANTDTFENDLEQLVAYVRKKAPKAKVLIIGDWWSKDKDAMRRTAAKETSCPFVDLSEVIQKKEFQSKEGTSCLLPDGTTIAVSQRAETHPGDKGMEYIAHAIITTIENTSI